MKITKYVGQEEVDVRYEEIDGELWFAVYDLERCVQNKKRSFYNRMYKRHRSVIETESGRPLMAINRKFVQETIDDGLVDEPDFLLWFESFCKEHAPVSVVQTAQNASNVVSLHAHQEESPSYMKEDLIIDAYFSQPTPAIREMTRNFLVAAKRMNEKANDTVSIAI